jgi:hypothetical protein
MRPNLAPGPAFAEAGNAHVVTPFPGTHILLSAILAGASADWRKQGFSTSLRFYFAKIGVNERNGDLTPIDQQHVVSGLPTVRTERQMY